jgi:hypothetical protein
MVFYHFDDSTLARARTGSRVLWYPAHGDQCFSHQSYLRPRRARYRLTCGPSLGYHRPKEGVF